MLSKGVWDVKDFQGKTVFITGSSRGIGKEIALHLAKAGANIIITGKTTEAHPKLEGTIYSARDEIAQTGAKVTALALDVRDDAAIQHAMSIAAQEFGGIDILINNASAISLSDTTQTEMKRFDLMFDVNVRASFAASQAAIPYLKKSSHPHILILSPPINLNPKWFKDHLAYTMSKYGMSMCVLGLSEELREANISVNALWPKTTIATAAIQYNFPKEVYQASRKPEIVAQAALCILKQKVTGQFFIDEDILRAQGETDFSKYAVDTSAQLKLDLFLD
ncbi:NAD(P)-dependent oxidoreductase [Candidatus Berkiella cookevillensis]|uniref:NAD(P)-dependent oxidoreductase n=1 Tax=Candidatus Berkiella cookevillensis TaxID=437022 RepID=A0AAE3L6V0_9GAMM|nr:NAD(P)-dependent oxidoreductase [Candidatus Berkiella cookevillensis]